MKLSKRLKAISDLIPDSSKVIDVGSDHALLDIYLNLYKNCTCLATDISPYCTEKAQKNASKYNANIKAITNDGLNGLKLTDEIIVISGMGTKNIIKILNINLTNDLIIGSHTKINDLKDFLLTKNYYIDKEIEVFDKRNYTIIYAKSQE